MNHCIQGGVGDVDGGEVDGEGSEERRAAVARGTPSPPPASWGAPPLSPLPSWLLGGGKNMVLEAGNSWVEAALHELGFPPLYRLPDFRQPL